MLEKFCLLVLLEGLQQEPEDSSGQNNLWRKYGRSVLFLFYYFNLLVTNLLSMLPYLC